jgi:hypothetical protein
VAVGVRNLALRDVRTWYHGPKPSLTISGGHTTTLNACDFRHEDAATPAAIQVLVNQTRKITSVGLTISGAGGVDACDPADQFVELAT